MMMHWDNSETLQLSHAVISLAHRCCCMLTNGLLLKLEPINSERPISSCLIIVFYLAPIRLPGINGSY